jgi:Co/Zn/Cd efflux system component
MSQVDLETTPARAGSEDLERLRRAVRVVAILNLAYFGVEFAVAKSIGSVSLFADSIDFLEDAAVNLLILVALGWTVQRRSAVGMLLAAILLVPGIATLWTAWEKLVSPIPPAAIPLTLAGAGALAVNFYCAGLLVRFRHASGSLTRAAFLSARNDVIANIAIVVAGFATRITRSPWPDLAVGLGIFLMNLDAAREVYEAAREERKSAVIDVAESRP